MRNFIKTWLIWLGIAIIVIIAGLALLILIEGLHENTTKKLLAQEIFSLPIPQGCHESKRQYEIGGVDTQSTWNIQYSCQTSAGEANDEITSGLRQQGFTVPHWAPPNSIDSLKYQNSVFEVEYGLIGGDNNYNQTITRSTLISGIDISISRTQPQ